MQLIKLQRQKSKNAWYSPSVIIVNAAPDGWSITLCLLRWICRWVIVK